MRLEETTPVELVSIDQAGKLLSLSPWTIRSHVKRKTIRATRCGRRVLIPIGEIRRIREQGLPSLGSETLGGQPK